MGSAMYTAVTSLMAHQRRLDVVANNIANVNTTGYRGSRVLFEDLFSQTLQGARAPVGNFGGSNAMQVGLGVRVATIDTDFSQGSLITTGVASDLAIQGAGFFVLSDGVADFFSRDGSFTLNANGLFIDPATGLRVQGFSADAIGNIDVNGAPGDLAIPVGATSIVRATTIATLVGNLDEQHALGDTVERPVRVFDSLGAPRTVVVTFTKQPAGLDGGGNPVSNWDWSAEYVDDTNTRVPLAGASGSIEFDSGGVVSTGNTGTITLTNAELGTPDSPPVDPFTFTIDFNSVTQQSSANTSGPLSDVTLLNQDGFPRGTLESFNIGQGGTINGVFTNGLTRVIGQVALANFSNEGGLARFADNLFRDTPASGAAQIGVANSGGRGTITGGVLEGSNVDLGTEFSNMIVTQRGFQANARTITTADTILQETVNLVR